MDLPENWKVTPLSFGGQTCSSIMDHQDAAARSCSQAVIDAGYDGVAIVEAG